MPASLYRLAGRPHHVEVAVAAVSELPSIEETAITQEISSPAEDHIEVISTVEITEVVDPAPAPELGQVEAAADVVEPTTTYPAWDPSWTKAKLLEVAASLNLSVTVENTKAQIVAALTEATST